MVLRFAPKGHNVKAWGNAPGKWREEGKAPTGRNEFASSFRPVGALDRIFAFTQGVALGYHLVGLWPGIALRALGTESDCVRRGIASFFRASYHQ